MSRFNIQGLRLAGLQLVERNRLGDPRGFLSRLFCRDELASCGWTRPLVQINHTGTSKRGTVRGLHFQRPPHAEMKLVSCIRGEVWDVAVDLRVGSTTYLEWHAEYLSAANGRALLIPEGFAHGFQALTDDVEMIYCHSEAYAPHAEAGLHPKDPMLSIEWPLDISEMSARDMQHPPIDTQFAGILI